MKNVLILSFLLLYCLTSFAQNPSLYIPRNIQQAYDKGSRSIDGNPGKNYWQNKGDYNIKIHFNPHTLLLEGSENITYRNNSPDTLHEIVFRLYPDLFKKGIARDPAFPVEPEDEGEGVTIDHITVNKQLINMDDAKTVKRKETNFTIKLNAPLLPHDATLIDIAWHYTLNKGSHIRTGVIDSTSSFIAYCFPRITVYDDLHGWDNHYYNGLQEFYNDFGQFDVSITVPKNYVVWATGQLQNAKDVLQKNIYDRYTSAFTSDNIIHVIDSTDFQAHRVTPDNPENTWEFTASDVTDFAFAVSNHYLWDASSVVVDKASGRRVLVDVAFNKDHKSYYEVPKLARQSVDLMSSTFPAVPFPFPHETVIDGLDQMEYPMMVNDNPVDTRLDDIELVVHEIFHFYFPFYMGINETQYAWMDEGWASVGEMVLTPLIDDSARTDPYGINDYAKIAGTEKDASAMNNSSEFTGKSPFHEAPYFINSYPKPALAYLFLKEMLGKDTFNLALHHYMDVWHDKHPMPYDFFNCINKASGKNLDWYWKAWFFDVGYPDLAIDSVGRDNNSYNYLRIKKNGSVPVPIHLTVYLSDGSKQTIKRSAGIWEDRGIALELKIRSLYKITKLVLGDEMVPDSKPEDNVWVRK